MERQQRADRLITVAIVTILVLTLAQASWLGYAFLLRPRIEANRLPPSVTDLRGASMPSLAGLTPVGSASLEAELNMPVTLVAFLLTTCPACNNAKATLEAFKRENPETVGLVGIFAESDEAVASYPAQYPRFVDSDREIFDVFGATSVPMILVLREGEVVSQTVGWSPEIGRRLSRVVTEGG